MKQVGRIFSFAFCVLMFSAVFSFPLTTTASPQPTVEWVARWNGPQSANDVTYGLVLGPSGNVYVTGIGIWNGYTGHEYVTIGYDSSGNELWVARYDGPESGDDGAHDIAVDSSENIYVTGHSVGRGTSMDYATIAYDSTGNELWAARYDGPAGLKDYGTALALDASGNVYVTGRSHDGFELFDFATVAYDSSGNELWVARYDGPRSLNDEPQDIAVDPFGNVYVTGLSNRPEIAPPGEGYDSEWATIAYDSSGNELWVARYNGPGGLMDSAWAIDTDSAGNVYVTGYSTGSGWADSDYTTISYDPNGNERWVARYDGPASGYDEVHDIAVDSSENIYVTGHSAGTGGDSDYTTISYDPNGNELWVARYDGPGFSDDVSRSVEVDPLGNIYITGISRETNVPWDWDFVTIAYDSSGNELWLARYDGGIGDTDMSTDIAVDPYGNVYVTGSSRYNDTGHDIVTMKYASGHAPEPTLDIDPDTLNLKSKGRRITAYIELYDGRDVRDIDISTILLNETIPAERWPTAIGDHDEDGIPDLMVKFDRNRVQEYIEGLNLSNGGAGRFGYEVTLTVAGMFNDGTTFECSDTIRVLPAERMSAEPSPFHYIADRRMKTRNPEPISPQTGARRTPRPLLARHF
jgi:hypothetical protein